MTRITSLLQNTQNRQNLQSVQQQMANLQRQISSGKESQNMSGLGSNVRSSIDLRADLSRIETYRNNISTTNRRIDTQSKVMIRMGDIANEIRDEILKAKDGQAPNMGLINDLAKSAIDEFDSLMDTEHEGRYLFSGTEISTKPSLDPTANLAFVDTELTGYNSGNIASKIANIRARFATPSNYYQGDTSTAEITSRIDDNLDVSYGFRGDNKAIQEIMSGLHIMAELDYDPAEHDTFTTAMDEAATDLKSGFNNINREVAKLGNISKTLEQTLSRHSDNELLLETQISNIEDVDVAEKITELLALQTQLQSSYNVISTVKNLNLANFI